MMFDLFPPPVMTQTEQDYVDRLLSDPAFQKYCRVLAYGRLMEINLLQQNDPATDPQYMRLLARAHGSLEVLHTLHNRATHQE